MDRANIRQQILTEAISIGDQLLNSAVETGSCLTWKTIVAQPGTKGEIIYATKENAYNGVSGICLFLCELYVQTKDEKYLYASIRGMRWVDEMHDNGDGTYALFTGKMSVAIVLLRLFAITKDASFLQNAVQISLDSEHNMFYHVYDLINGISGTLLGLLHVHSASQDPRLLRIIALYTERLFKTMHAGKHGICWDRNEYNIHSLCGFSHGASGLAYLFIEMGFYFTNPAFYEIARQLFLYENQFFNGGIQNWRDLRATDEIRFGLEIEQAYASGDRLFFNKEIYMNAWCHGAAGIGLSKVRAIEILPECTTISNELSICINTTLKTTIQQALDFDSSCLCHGSAGNGELFLEAYRVSQNESHLDMAYQVAKKLLDQKNSQGYYTSGNPGGVEDNSLFMGNAGVGHFLLRTLEPNITPSLLGLRVGRTCKDPVFREYSGLNITLIELHNHLVSVDFKRTYIVAELLFSESVHEYFKVSDIGNFNASWIKFINSLLMTSHPHVNVLADILNFELSVHELNLSIESDSLLFLKERKKKNDKINLLADNINFEGLRLVTDGDLLVVQTGWSWNLEAKDDWVLNCKREESRFYYLLIPTYVGILEQRISEFSKIVLEAFQESTLVFDAIKIIDEFFDDSEPLQKVRQIVIHQIKELIEAGFLLDPSKHLLNKRNRPLTEVIRQNE